jgi:ABC-type glycerol-3-phosphate transport system permease component
MITLIGTIATIVGIAVTFGVGIFYGIIIALIILLMIPTIILFLVLFPKYLIKGNFFYTPWEPVTPPILLGVKYC